MRFTLMLCGIGGTQKMAIYQFNIEFFPSEGVTRELGSIPEQLPNEYLPEQLDMNSDFEDFIDPRIKFWNNRSREHFSVLVTELTNKLPEVEWLKNSTDIYSWGHEDTNDLTLCFSDNNTVESFGCRIDIRTLDEDFIDLVLELCTSNNFLIADSKGNLRTPSRHELGKLMANSNPANFVADPEKFLNDFERGKRKPE